MNNLTLKITAPIVLTIVVVAALFFLFENNATPARTVELTQSGALISEPPTEKDPRHEAVETYFSLMQQEQYSKMNELWPNTVAGNTEGDPKADASVSDDEKQILRENLDFTSYYKYHHDQVIAFFGEKAWDNVKFEMTKMPAPEGTGKWFEKSTGKEISFEESVKLNEQYWNKVLEENNWTEKDVFTPEGKEETAEEAALREKNHAKYIDGEPTEYILEEDYERYAVELLFDGKKEAKTGEHQFKITITNKGGKWGLYDMLSWNPTISEPTSEV